jgi:hypothetical protein
MAFVNTGKLDLQNNIVKSDFIEELTISFDPNFNLLLLIKTP